MKRTSKFAVIIWLLSLTIIVQCSKDDKQPDFAISISPESGAPGAQVNITGKGFGLAITDNKVFFNDTEATVIQASATLLTVQVPVAATTGAVSVETGTTTITGPVFTVTVLKPTKTYYIKFKMNGFVKVFEDGNPGYQSCGDCACSYLPAPIFNSSRIAGIDICNPNNIDVVASDIRGWDKKKFSFNTGVFPAVSFGFTENNVSYYSGAASDQTGSEVSITNVESDGQFFGKLSYKVTGTFKCQVAKDDGTLVTALTEGEFVVRYSEY